MITNDAGKDLIKRWESLQLNAYKCPAGIWTIGYGHTGDVEEGMKITAHQADAILDADLAKFERGVEEALQPAKVNENEFSACVSLAFNIGLANFKTSSVVKFIKAGVRDRAALSFSLWDKARDPKTGQLRELAGLAKRRTEEAALFLRPLVHA